MVRHHGHREIPGNTPSLNPRWGFWILPKLSLFSDEFFKVMLKYIWYFSITLKNSSFLTCFKLLLNEEQSSEQSSRSMFITAATKLSGPCIYRRTQPKLSAVKTQNDSVGVNVDLPDAGFMLLSCYSIGIWNNYSLYHEQKVTSF